MIGTSERNFAPTDYDTVVFLRFLPATAGEEVRTFKGDGAGEDRPPGFSDLGSTSLASLFKLAFSLGVCERPFTFLGALLWISGRWPFDSETWEIGDGAANTVTPN
jgi:hypothetical protein